MTTAFVTTGCGIGRSENEAAFLAFAQETYSPSGYKQFKVARSAEKALFGIEYIGESEAVILMNKKGNDRSYVVKLKKGVGSNENIVAVTNILLASPGSAYTGEYKFDVK